MFLKYNNYNKSYKNLHFIKTYTFGHRILMKIGLIAIARREDSPYGNNTSKLLSKCHFLIFSLISKKNKGKTKNKNEKNKNKKQKMKLCFFMTEHFH